MTRSDPTVPRKAMETYADLLARCVPVKVQTLAKPCQIWQGGTSKGRPAAQFRGADGVKTVFLGQSITAELTGATKPEKAVWTNRCGDPLCMAREHLTSMTRAALHQRASQHRGVEAIQAAMQARRDAGQVHPEWMREWAIESSQPGAEVASYLGVSKSAVNAWRRKAGGYPMGSRGAPQVATAWGAMLGFLGAETNQQTEVIK